MAIAPSTPRRSTRGTIFTPSPSVASPSLRQSQHHTSYIWNSAPLPRKPSDGAVDGGNTEGEEEGGDEGVNTRYNSFSRITSKGPGSTSTSTPSHIGSSLLAGGPNGKGKGKGKGDEEARFTIGDGVQVSVDGGDEGVGILIGLWEETAPATKSRGVNGGNNRDEEEDELALRDEEEEEDEDEGPKMMAEIHWAFRKQDLPSIMKTANVQENEVLLAASTTFRPVTSILPVQLLVRTIPIYSKAFYREQFPETQSKVKGWSYIRQGVFWCHRAFDKFAKGGKSWKVDIDEWREGGKKGLGWKVQAYSESDGRGAIKDDSEDEEASGDDSDGSVAGPGDEPADDDDDSDQGADEDEDEDEDGDTFKLNQRKRKRTARTTTRKTKRAKTTKAGTGRRKIQPLPSGAGRGKLKKVSRLHPHPKSSASHLPSSNMALEDLPVDPYERALRLLHVGATPESLPCREEEFVDVLGKVEEGVESGGGGCLYIAGVPGTGKTATVHAVVKELKRKAEDGEIPPFSYVEINGLKIPSPQHAYSVLWEAISGAQKGASTKTALRGLEAHFGRKVGRGVRGPRGHTFVVLMDELDQLLTSKQDVVYNFFNWPTMPDSQLFVIAVANRMDLPQHLAAKIKSRIGLQTILFQPYDRSSLISIVQSRLIPHPSAPSGDPKVLLPDAIALAATKMAGTNGDARRVLDACRRAVEVAIEPKVQGHGHGKAATNGAEITKKQDANSKNDAQTQYTQAQNQPHPVTAKEMMAVLQAMSASPVSKFIAGCSIQQKTMLAALVRCVRREGLPEIPWRNVRMDHDALCRSLIADLVAEAALVSSAKNTGKSGPVSGNLSGEDLLLSNSELSLVLTSLIASHALVASSDTYKSTEERKIALGMEVGEVGRVLMGEGEGWRRALAGV